MIRCIKCGYVEESNVEGATIDMCPKCCTDEYLVMVIGDKAIEYFQKTAETIVVLSDKVIELINQINKTGNALFDLVDGHSPEELVQDTGLSEERCNEIYNIAYEWWNGQNQ